MLVRLYMIFVFVELMLLLLLNFIWYVMVWFGCGLVGFELNVYWKNFCLMVFVLLL